MVEGCRETETSPRLAPALGSRESGNDDGGCGGMRWREGLVLGWGPALAGGRFSNRPYDRGGAHEGGGDAGAPFECPQDRLRQAQGEWVWEGRLRRGGGGVGFPSRWGVVVGHRRASGFLLALEVEWGETAGRRVRARRVHGGTWDGGCWRSLVAQTSRFGAVGCLDTAVWRVLVCCIWTQHLVYG